MAHPPEFRSARRQRNREAGTTARRSRAERTGSLSLTGKSAKLVPVSQALSCFTFLLQIGSFNESGGRGPRARKASSTENLFPQRLQPTRPETVSTRAPRIGRALPKLTRCRRKFRSGAWPPLPHLRRRLRLPACQSPSICPPTTRRIWVWGSRCWAASSCSRRSGTSLPTRSWAFSWTAIRAAGGAGATGWRWERPSFWAARFSCSFRSASLPGASRSDTWSWRFSVSTRAPHFLESPIPRGARSWWTTTTSAHACRAGFRCSPCSGASPSWLFLR